MFVLGSIPAAGFARGVISDKSNGKGFDTRLKTAISVLLFVCCFVGANDDAGAASGGAPPLRQVCSSDKPRAWSDLRRTLVNLLETRAVGGVVKSR